MRASVGGWLLKSESETCPPVNGWMMNMCAVAGFASSGTRFGTASIFLQRVGQAVGIAGQLRPGRIGRVLARPRNRHLNQQRGHRRQDDHREQARWGCCPVPGLRRGRRTRRTCVAYIAIRPSIMIVAARSRPLS